MTPRGIRTYGELIDQQPYSSIHGTCCACHQWNRPTWQLSTRASICRECAERKRDEVLGSIRRSERRARSWIKRHPDTHDQPKWLASITGASEEFIKAEIAKVRS